MSTGSGWGVQLRTRQDVAWLELSGANDTPQVRWYGTDYFPVTNDAGNIGTTTNRFNAFAFGSGNSSILGNLSIGTTLTPHAKLSFGQQLGH